MQLQDVARAAGGGAQVVAVGTDEPDEARALAKQLGLTYPILSDPDSTLARSLDLVHPEPFGRGTVPYPTTIVLDEHSQVVWSRTGTTVADRPTTRQILAAITRATTP